MTSQVMRTLESRQLITRKKHPRDTRALVLNVIPRAALEPVQNLFDCV